MARIELYRSPPELLRRKYASYVRKKTKVALFENLFYLFEKKGNEERTLKHSENVYELICAWEPNSENQLICDLNLDTKNTVKSKMKDSYYDTDENKYHSENYDFDDEYATTEEDKSLEIMIAEMMKLKNQLKEENAALAELEQEEQNVDILISRLAAL